MMIGAVRFGITFLALVLANTAPLSAQTTAAPAPAGKTTVIFGVSWQPGFCETRVTRPECVSQTSERADARQFSLHGLWPVRKSYCGVTAEVRALDRKGDWLKLAQPVMETQTFQRLQVAMPGWQSGLDRHQWLRSGTCQAETADAYFRRQLSLLDQLNGSSVQRLFAGSIGKEVTQAAVKQAFDEAFGPSAGDRVQMRCQKDGDRTIVTGLTIGLSSDGMVTPRSAASPAVSVIPASALAPGPNGERAKATVAQGVGAPDLSVLIHAAGATDFKCARGVVDAAGLQ